MALASTGRLLAGRYRVLGRLGVGGMAVVVLAEDERLGRKVAVKRLHAESPEDAARRFQREAKVGASLNHPNIVAVYDTVVDEDGVLIVMEYVEGPTLRQVMDGGPMEPARAMEVLSGIAAALDHAHANGVVHRDVKPANVLIADRDGTVKLTDLGIATAAESTHITRTGMVLGTAAYMAPERLDGQAGGPAVDVYATAAVAFEMLSGSRAVTGSTPIEVARRVMDAPPPDLAEALPGAPRRAAEVLKRGLAKDPAERPASAGDLVRQLSAAYADDLMERPQTAPTRPLVSPSPNRGAPAAPRRRGWLAPAALAAVAAVVLAIVLLSGGSDDGGTTASRTPAPAAKKPAPKAKSAPSAPAPQPRPVGAATPVEALTGFYTRAANDDFEGAWALGTDALHAKFGSLEGLRATVATLQSISFPELRVTSQSGDAATVAFSSIAQHTDRTDRCTGQARLVGQSGGWLVDHLDVACGSDEAKPKKPKKPREPKKPKGGHKGPEKHGPGGE